MSKSGADKVQSAALGHNAGNLKSFTDKLVKLKKEQDDLRMETLAIYNQASDQGFDRKALKAVVKEITTQPSEDLRAEINDMLEQLGKKPIFKLGASA